MFTPAISPADPQLMMVNCDMSGAYLSEDGGKNWQMISHLQLKSDIRCRPAFHPKDRNIIFASSGGELRRSRDRGKTFSRVAKFQEALDGEVAINPGHPEMMLVGTMDGRCWWSSDNGEKWARCEGPRGEVIGFYFDQTKSGKIMFAATKKGIWRSDDAGKTWLAKTEGLPWKEVQGFAGGSRGTELVLYCTVKSKDQSGFKGGVYRSRDGGDSWQSAMGTGLNQSTVKSDQWSHGPISQYEQVLTSDARPATVYVMNTSTGFHPPNFDTVYRSDDYGATWKATYYMDPRFKDYNVSPDYVTASRGRTYKGGEAPFGAVLCNSDPERLILVRNECHVTYNGGRDWLSAHTTPAPDQKPGPGSSWLCNGLVVTTTWHYYVDPFEPNRHYICYTDVGFARSLDTGKSWIWWDEKSEAPWNNTCYELAFDPEVPGKIWGAFSNVHDIPNDNIISERHGHKGPGGICVSKDFGASWKPAGTGLPLKAMTSIVVDPTSAKNARVLYAGIFEGGIGKSIDDGKTWTIRTNGLGSAENKRVSKVLRHTDGTLFAMVCARRASGGTPLLPNGVGLYRSHDQGESWEKANAGKTWLYPKDFSVDAANSAHILVGTCDPSGKEQEGGLYATTDAGKTWDRIGREGSQTFGGYFNPRKKGWIYMTLTEGAPGPGLWLSEDDGKTWTAFRGLPFSNIQRVEFDPQAEDHLFVTTFGGSVWRGPIKPSTN